jgi:hypothetical protein
MEARQRRGLEIALRLGVAKEGDCYWVASQFSGDIVYRVRLCPPCCECPDFAERRLPCKHWWAATFAEMADRGEKLPDLEYPKVVPSGAPKWVTIDLIQETLFVWQFYYREDLTPDDALEMVLGVSRLQGLEGQSDETE